MNLKKIEDNLEEVQNEQLKILIEFDRICRKNNINYQLFAGTLLGAVRHQGFIPWDDDIDVCMLREDYDLFLKIFQNEFDKKYFLQIPKTDKEYPFSFAKIRRNDTLFVESKHSELNMHHGIFIDIFPLDNILPKGILGKVQFYLLSLLRKLKSYKIKKNCLKSPNFFRKKMKLFIHYLLKPISMQKLNQLDINISKLIKKGNGWVSHLSHGQTNKIYMKYAMKKEKFENTIEGEFEEHQFLIPRNYDEVLERLFGDYTKFPPVEEQKPHHKIYKISFNTKLKDKK